MMMMICIECLNCDTLTLFCIDKWHTIWRCPKCEAKLLKYHTNYEEQK